MLFIYCSSSYLFCLLCYGDHRDLHLLPHPFPTRRSSDLLPRPRTLADRLPARIRRVGSRRDRRCPAVVRLPMIWHSRKFAGASERSEEHTSELQSLMRISYAVFCLKKKTISTSTIKC